MNPTLWKIFARLPSKWKDSEDYARECFQAGLIAVGWSELGDLNAISSRDELHRLLDKRWGHEAENGHKTISQWAGALWSFRTDVKPGDHVICPDSDSDRFYAGIVRSKKVHYDRQLIGGKCDFAHRREVRWIRTLDAREIDAIWPSGRFGGNQTVTEVTKGVNGFLKVIGKPKRRFVARPRLPVRPDMEWGLEAEARAMEWLKERGYSPENVSRLNMGWDISCGEDRFEVKGRKSSSTAIRLSQNEWSAAEHLKKRYTVLVFTAGTKELLRKAVPMQISDPCRTESWTPRAVYEYILAE